MLGKGAFYKNTALKHRSLISIKHKIRYPFRRSTLKATRESRRGGPSAGKEGSSATTGAARGGHLLLPQLLLYLDATI